jgi:glycosyltransferase involved in cell wall biosynthesis
VPETPLVSVVTATYNWSSVLRYAIQSVLWQECQDFEMLVIGDGCTDDSAEVVASFDDPRVRWHNLPENSGSQGIPNAAGIAFARGRFIAYLGHDDLWLPSHLSTLVQTLTETGADIAYTLVSLIGPEGTNFHAIAGLSQSGGYEPDLLLPPSCAMHRRELAEEIGGWKDYRTIVEPPDREFFNRAFDAGKRFVSVPQLTVCKFPALWRKNSYLHRRSDEQAAYSQRIQADAHFLTDELLAIIATYALERRLSIPFPKAPEEIEPGWYVREYRRIRGLEPTDDPLSAPDGAMDDEAAPRTWSAHDIRPERYRQMLERALRERELQLADAERYMRALEAEIASKERAHGEAMRENATLHQHAAEQGQQAAEIARYVRALERDLAHTQDEVSRATVYAQSLEHALATRDAALRDSERYARSLEGALADRDEALRLAKHYVAALEIAIADRGADAGEGTEKRAP